MWSRFTERARRVVFFAQEEAQRREQWNVSGLHLMLGILREDGSPSVAQRALMILGRDRAELYRLVEAMIPTVREIPAGDLQLSPDARRAIDWSYEEARLLKNHYLGTEHLLLGVFAVQEKVLALLPPDGINRVRAIIQELQGPNAEPATPQPQLADYLEALPPQDRARLSGDGLPFHSLPPDAAAAVIHLFRLNEGAMFDFADSLLRLREETDAEGKRYHLSLSLTAHATIPARMSTTPKK